MGSEHRRHQRYDVDLPAMMIEGSTARGVTVRNVSFDGLLVVAKEPAGIRKLLRLELSLPTDAKAIRLTAMAVYCSPPDEDGTHRVGIQFFGLEPATRRRWDQYIVAVRSGQAPVPVKEGAAKRRTKKRPTVLQAGPPELRILLDSKEMVEAICAQILDHQQLYIRTDVRIALGRELWVTLYHPSTAKSVAIPAKVRQQYASEKFIGLAVVPRIEEAERAALEDFEKEHVSITIELDPDDLMGLEDVVELEAQTRAPIRRAS